MHIQKIHYGKLLVVLALFLILIISIQHLLISNNSKFNTIDVEAYSEVGDKDDNSLVAEELRSQSESVSWASLHTCPVCLGRELCPELQQGFITVGVFPKGDTKSGTLQEYTGLLKGEEHLTVLSPEQHLWDNWDDYVCKNSSQWSGCLVGEAAKTSFLAKNKFESPPFLRSLGVPEGSSPHPVTACSTWGFSTEMRRAFDTDNDDNMTEEEKVVMLTTIAVSPGLAMLRLGQYMNLQFIPRYIGACGRVLVTNGELTPISSYLDSDWSTRSDIALQILYIVGGGMLNMKDWMFIVWEITWDSFAVTQSGQVILRRLDNMTPIEKSLVPKPEEMKDDELRPVCNKDCFDKFREDVMQHTPRGQAGKGCRDSLLKGDLMFQLVCSNIFSKVDGNDGLLHGAEEEVTQLVDDCVDEKGKGERWRAVDQLIRKLSGLQTTTVGTEASYEKAEKENVGGEDYYEEGGLTTRRGERMDNLGLHGVEKDSEGVITQIFEAANVNSLPKTTNDNEVDVDTKVEKALSDKPST